jgi:hypothetical protein
MLEDDSKLSEAIRSDSGTAAAWLELGVGMSTRGVAVTVKRLVSMWSCSCWKGFK